MLDGTAVSRRGINGNAIERLEGRVPQFDEKVPPGGYRWWYLDGVSDCGTYGLTVIAFIGSVFSPYYAWSGRKDPENHVAMNVALYAPGGDLWAMTERGRGSLQRDASTIRIGPSSMTWDDDGLLLNFSEVAVPRPPFRLLPKRIEGSVRVRFDTTNRKIFKLDQKGKHNWWPVAPVAGIETSFSDRTACNWSGHGYLDANWGSEPLEDGFNRWDWARTRCEEDQAVVVYDLTEADGARRKLRLHFTRNGSHVLNADLQQTPLPTGFWGVRRSVPSEESASSIRTLEDSPFYVRSLIETELLGAKRVAMHETFNGSRFASPFVKMMLPFRMPRYTGGAMPA
ncbi:MAG: carotenoid 1,2-hydratase [Pseudomonadota bacterium]